jgi:hypothetical protein
MHSKEICMTSFVPALVLTFVNATTPAPALEAKALEAIQASTGQTPASAIAQQQPATIINIGDFKRPLMPAQFRAAVTSAEQATSCKMTAFEAPKVKKDVSTTTGKIVFSETPALATLNCGGK